MCYFILASKTKSVLSLKQGDSLAQQVKQKEVRISFHPRIRRGLPTGRLRKPTNGSYGDGHERRIPPRRTAGSFTVHARHRSLAHAKSWAHHVGDNMHVYFQRKHDVSGRRLRNQRNPVGPTGYGPGWSRQYGDHQRSGGWALPGCRSSEQRHVGRRTELERARWHVVKRLRPFFPCGHSPAWHHV